MTMVEVAWHHRPVLPIQVSGSIGGRVRMMGWNVRETSGAATALVQITNAPSGGGIEVMSIPLNANEGVRDWFGPEGIELENGYFPTITGAVAGSVFVKISGDGGR